MPTVREEALAEGGVRLGQFTCPVCGGHYWGTCFKSPNGPFFEDAEGYCNGWIRVSLVASFETDRRCQFTWPRSEDAKYFSKGVPTGLHERVHEEAEE